MAQIPCCYGSGVGQQLQLRLDPYAWNPPYAAGAALEKAKKTPKNQKKQKNKKTKKEILKGFLSITKTSIMEIIDFLR